MMYGIFVVADVNVAYRQAMIKVAMNHEELSKNFQLTLNFPTGELGSSKKKQSSWRFLGMTHTVAWPLHVVFTPAALEK